jgi:hypothetical protein
MESVSPNVVLETKNDNEENRLLDEIKGSPLFHYLHKCKNCNRIISCLCVMWDRRF